MRDETLDNINEKNFNILVNLHPSDGTHWVLIIRRNGGRYITLTVLVLRFLLYY